MAAPSLIAHAVADLFPQMTHEEYEALKADIDKNGLLEPIVLFEGRIIDGRHRYRACQELGRELQTREIEGVPAVLQAVALNARRRHLSGSQLAAIATEADELVKEYENAAKERRKRKPKSVPEQLPEQNGKDSRDDVGNTFGISGRLFSDAKTIKQESPELHKEIVNGTKTVAQAKQQLRSEKKLAELEQKAARASFENDQPSWTLIHADVFDGLQSVHDHHAAPRLIFADPPYNIGIDYGQGSQADKLTHGDYLEWVGKWLTACHEVLAEDGSLWVMIGDEYAAEYRIALRRIGFVLRSWVIWYESFGVNCSRSFNRTHRHLFYCIMDPKRFVFNESEVKRPSDRQTKYNDARAIEGGKILDDVWFDVPRLTGTCDERIPQFPTQLPIALVRRIVDVSSEPGDLVVDPFCGSGTTGAACLTANHGPRKFIGIEKSEQFIDLADKRLKAVAV